MATQPNSFLTPEEYLAIDRAAEFRSEYHDGEIFAMSGSSYAHNQIVSNVAHELRTILGERDCDVISNDLRLTTGTSYSYPDIMVVCGKPVFVDSKRDTLTNPILIIEVLSPSTANYDLGGKFQLYKRIPSLQEYLTVSQNEIFINHSIRQPNNSWLVTEIDPSDAVISLSSLGLTLQLTAIYKRVLA